MKGRVWLGALMFVGAGLNGGACIKKSPEQEKAEVRSEARKDIVAKEREANKDVADVRKDEAKDVAEIRKDAAEDLRKIDQKAAEESKDNYSSRMSTRLDSLDNEISSVQKRVDAKGDAAKADLANVMADVKAKRDAANVQLKSLKEVAESNWTQMLGGVENAFVALENSLQAARQNVEAH